MLPGDTCRQSGLGGTSLKASVTVRRAHPEEAEALTALGMRSKASNGYDDAFMTMCREEMTVSISEIETAAVWIAQSDRTDGFFSLLPPDNERVAELRMFFIEPNRHRKGVGRALWMKMEECAHELGVRAIGVDSDPFAVSFYQAMGMKVVGEAPSGSIPGRMLPRMEKVLEEPS